MAQERLTVRGGRKTQSGGDLVGGEGAVRRRLALNCVCVCVCLCVRALLQVSVSAQGSVMNKVIATKCV